LGKIAPKLFIAIVSDGAKASLLGATLVVAGGAVTGAAPPPASSPPAHWSDAQKERFLLEGQVVRRRSAPGGVTNSSRVTLRLDDVEHDAHVQPIDERAAQKALGSGIELDFRDSWRNNVAAYRLDRVLGLRMVPVTVTRVDEYKSASFTWWVDDVLMTESDRHLRKVSAPDPEAWNRQVFVVRLFDQLIYNADRNLGNLLIDRDWQVHMIDHTRAFKIFRDLKSEKNLALRCEKDLLAALRGLDKASLQPLMRNLLGESQIDALLARRDRIVRHYETLLAARGEESVLYDLPPRN
jgi:hypothetical protein